MTDTTAPPTGAPAHAGRVIAADRLRSFAQTLLEAAGMPAADAELCADGMVWADVRGIEVGTFRLTMLIDRIRAGSTEAAARLETLSETASTAVVDAHDAWGQVAAAHGMRVAIAKARASGIGLCSIRNSGNALAMGYYPSLAIAERMIGIAITNALPLQAPWGGTRKVLGNQAFAIGAPAGRHAPLIFDSATSAITWAKIRKIQEHGGKLPPGVALDSDARPTIDPEEAMKGLLLPLGGHWGYGLALMWEVLTGVLSGGANFGPTVLGGFPTEKPAGQSQLMVAIDPSVSMPYDEFVRRVDSLIDAIHASPLLDGVDVIRTPGERGARDAERAEREGIALPPSRIAQLESLAALYNISTPW